MNNPKSRYGMNRFQNPDQVRLSTVVRLPETKFLKTTRKIAGYLNISRDDVHSGRYRLQLYRYLTDHVPVVAACVWTWARLAAAPGSFKVLDGTNKTVTNAAQKRLDDLCERVYTNISGQPVGLPGLLVEMFTSLFRDGIFGGFVTVRKDNSGVDCFMPVDSMMLSGESNNNKYNLYLETPNGFIELNHPDFYYLTLSDSITEPLGRSILQPIPFVSAIEQQLVHDMYRSHHNAGYSRIHVKITPPSRMSGESDQAYTDRINRYFDATVGMIRDCDVDENPVTWDNVAIEYIGPSETKSVTNSWFVNHRSMIEEICSGANLSPFLLGYSYGATTTWSNFKFDVVMRHVRSIQSQAAHLLEWIANLDLALAGIPAKCHFEFNNSFAYQARELVSVESQRVENLLKLFQSGLIDEPTAKEKAWHLI